MIRRAKGNHCSYTVTHSFEHMDQIARRIVAERDAWRQALGFPQGFEVPPKPLPSTIEELEAELAEVMAKAEEVTAACFREAPPSQERESLARHMLALEYRNWQLRTLKKEWSDQAE